MFNDQLKKKQPKYAVIKQTNKKSLTSYAEMLKYTDPEQKKKEKKTFWSERKSRMTFDHNLWFIL